MGTKLENTIKVLKMLMRKSAEKSGLIEQLQEQAAANEKKLRRQDRMLAKLRDENKRLTENGSETLRRLKIRRRHVKTYKKSVDDLQNQLDKQARDNGELMASIVEKERTVQRLNQNIVAANELAGLESRSSQIRPPSQHDKFTAIMQKSNGHVREVLGGVAGALG